MTRWPLLPFSGLYWIGTSLRNLMFNIGILKSHSYKMPIICVGNLSVGGTGKTPMVIYLVNLLKDETFVAVLSRGYGRNSSGFQVANYQTDYREIGDEPLSIFERYRNKIVVAVSESRVLGMKKLLIKYEPETIILDDAYQHRYIKAGYTILLTDYNNLYKDDYLLPAGGLRESSAGARRADVIMVTKCPDDMSENKKKGVIATLKPKSHQSVFFSHIKYHSDIISRNYNLKVNKLADYSAVVVSGIANDESFVEYAKSIFKHIEHLSFKDHHNYTDKDIQLISEKFSELKGQKIIFTTEKDYMRLKLYYSILDDLFYQPIDMIIDDKEKFDKLILNYVKQN